MKTFSLNNRGCVLQERVANVSSWTDWCLNWTKVTRKLKHICVYKMSSDFKNFWTWKNLNFLVYDFSYEKQSTGIYFITFHLALISNLQISCFMLFSHSPVVTVFLFYFKILSFSPSLNVWGSLLTYLHDSYSTSLMSGTTGWPKHASHFFWLSPIIGYTPCSL